MKTVAILPIEPIPTRYTQQWHISIPQELAKYRVNVINIDGDTEAGTPTPGAFLDFASTNQWKSEQLIKLLNLIKDGSLTNGDEVLITDAWNPTVIQLRYTIDLLGLDIKLHGIFHAGHYDKHDFLGRLEDKSKWISNTEKAMFGAYDYVYFATDFHIDMFKAGVIDSELKQYEHKIIKSGQPHDLLVNTLLTYPRLEKKRQIIFPHRLAPEKQLEIFKDLEQAMPDVEFVVCQERKLTKDQYHQAMSESMICFSASLQETFGISVQEAVLLGTVPVMPNRLSYAEIFRNQQALLYPSDWTIDFEKYQTYKGQLITYLYSVLDNFDFYREVIDIYLENDMPENMKSIEMFENIVNRPWGGAD